MSPSTGSIAVAAGGSRSAVRSRSSVALDAPGESEALDLRCQSAALGAVAHETQCLRNRCVGQRVCETAQQRCLILHRPVVGDVNPEPMVTGCAFDSERAT